VNRNEVRLNGDGLTSVDQFWKAESKVGKTITVVGDIISCSFVNVSKEPAASIFRLEEWISKRRYIVQMTAVYCLTLNCVMTVC